MLHRRRRDSDLTVQKISEIIEKTDDEQTRLLALILLEVDQSVLDLSKSLSEMNESKDKHERWLMQELKEIASSIANTTMGQDVIDTKMNVWSRIGAAMSVVGMSLAGGAFAQYLDIKDSMAIVKTKQEAMGGEITALTESLLKTNDRLLTVEQDHIKLRVGSIERKKVVQASK